MISSNELLSGHALISLPQDHQMNLQDLQVKINVVRSARGIPMGSMDLKGKACDIYDKDGSLMKWCRDNVSLIEKVGLWIEDDPSQPRVHFQTEPPKFGNKFFKP